ncbi:hypothetical protein [Flavobacterium sp.]|uniref:hypothetical protein n=1 Tax=Flavobacterium sp. TaxID=239 RepID=UPI0025DB4266|nr:hypothetical protein [Flavobacterium sp.]
MPISSTFYINSNSFITATSVYTDVTLSNKATDGYYSFGGIYRQQLFGKLLEPFNCDGSPISVDCVVSDWSGWSECIDGQITRTRTVITTASNGGAECPILTESQSCSTSIQCFNYSVENRNPYTVNVTWTDCDGITHVVGLQKDRTATYTCVQEGIISVSPSTGTTITKLTAC